MRIRPLEPHRQSLKALWPSSGCYYMLRPAGDTHARHMRISCFALPGEVSLHQADHVSSEEPAYSTRAGSATPALLLTKLVSLVRVCLVGGLCLFSCSSPCIVS
jgi:hypothetical protein